MICVQMRPECCTSQGSLSCSPRKSIWHEWRATDSTHNCTPGYENVLAVTAGWFISVRGFCLIGIRSWKSRIWWWLGMKELLNLSQRWQVGRASQSLDLGGHVILLYKTFSEVTHIYISPFGILLMEGNTEIEYILRPTVFWDWMQHKVVIPFRCLGITIRFHLQWSKCQRRTCLDSRQPAHIWCLLEELTVTELIEWQLIFRGDIDLFIIITYPSEVVTCDRKWCIWFMYC
jgi:hypothetical protein